MNNKESTIEAFAEECLVIITLPCHNCKEEFTAYDDDEHHLATSAYNNGWRQFKDEILCPSCYNKKKKNIKIINPKYC